MITLPLQTAFDPALGRRVNWYRTADGVRVFHPSPFRSKPGTWLAMTVAEFLSYYTA